MTSYQTIGVWEIWNTGLAQMLRKRGFREVREVLEKDKRHKVSSRKGATRAA